MDKRIYICTGIILFLALSGFVLYRNLEIYKYTTFTSPSRDVIVNSYYAMEQWLKETGHPVRFETNFSPVKFAEVEERVVIIHASMSRWNNAEEHILPWIEQGGYLIVCMEYYTVSLIDENLLKLLSGLGITVGAGTPEENNQEDDSPQEEDSPQEKDSPQEEDSPDESALKESLPNLGRNVHFLFDNDAEIFAIKDNYGYARVAEISIGKGALTVTSTPSFMRNNSLYNEINAKLAWKLTGARADGNNTGVLFVRERYLPKNIFGKIMERGNLLPVVISALLLIILGFWMVIPVFGLAAVEKQKTSRPIRERFIAEIRFLKKYRALDHYLDIYEQEQNPEGYSGNKKAYNYRELINQYRRIFNGTAKF
jgi:hypothetical protein